MTAELLRSTKKNPPSRLRYELIYVSLTVVKYPLKIGLTFAQTGKDEYDSSVKAEEKATFATGSVFQGLRADLEGFVPSRRENSITNPSDRTGAARVFIVSTCKRRLGGGIYSCRAIPRGKQQVSGGIWLRGLFRQ